LRPTTVYVVDDEEQICSLLTRILARDGLRVREFTRPTDALAAAADDAPDLVITDMMMPEMNGVDLAGKLKALHPATSVVVITGFASMENVVDALRSGVDDLVTKPFGVNDIRQVVQRVLARRPKPEDAPTTAPVVLPVPTTAEIGPAPTTAELTAATSPGPDVARDVRLLEAIHGLLGEDLESRDLAGRSFPILRVALDVSGTAIVVPGAVAGTWRRFGAAPSEEIACPALDPVHAAGVNTALDVTALAGIADDLGAGPAAAAPLRPRDRSAEDAGLLLLARAEGGQPFGDDDLRRAGMAANALGHVLHAIRSTERAEEAYVASLLDIVAASEKRAPCFHAHSARVRDLSVRLGRRVGLADGDLETLRTAAPLLDVGRIHIGDDVLSKQGRLSSDEWSRLRSHPEIADALIRPLGRLRHAKPVIRHHHENWDGSGYPDGLQGEDIPYLAALVRITDTFAALTSPRPWRAALEPREAVWRIVESSGTHFHPQLVAAFADMQHGDGAAEPAR